MELTSQVFSFVITIVTGILLGVLFDCYRVLRGTFKPKTLITWFTDLLYWLVATAVIFIALVASNWGELRFYVFMGIVSGLGIYYRWLSLYAIRLLASIARLIISILGVLKRIFISIFLRPGAYCMRMASKPFVFACHKTISWCQIRWPKRPEDEEK